MDDSVKTFLKKPVKSVKNVGDARARLFTNLGIFTVEDLITHFPRDYEDRTSLKTIMQLEDGDTCAFEGTIASNVIETRPRKSLSIYKVHIKDSSGMITATWFNQHYIKNVLKPGDRYMFYGSISRKLRAFEVSNPVYEKADGQELKNTGRIVPVYPATARLTQNIIRSSIENALQSMEGKLDDILPLELRKRYRLSEINYSLKNIHFPTSDSDFKNARYRLVFEELLILQLGLLSIKNSFGEEKKGIIFRPAAGVKSFLEALPFKLTNAQKKVFSEIERDMESPKVMCRLVQGDVGSGKTIVAVLALYEAVLNGYQGALMVPTEILAAQHYSSIFPLLSSLNVKVSLLTGSTAKKQKEQVLESIRTGETDIIIGTHALLEDNVEFKRLGLVVTDEQHRFGVRQRSVLAKKGENPDVLVMTATPIPRTLALILYGDLDISVIDELPPGRKPIETYAVDNSMRQRINAFIRKNIAQGRQVYIVCPLVEDSDSIEAKSAMETAEKIASEDFRDLNVGLIHGKMKPKEKDEVMKGFIEGRINILVSTTVIEVGVNVPNATVMVIENAERFGLAQLHQLRGRVGRGEHQSYCVLYNASRSELSKERMSVMQKTNDGFVISEKDLELRGPGEFFGTRQHGIPDLKIANLYTDMEILKKAQEAALEILKSDGGLSAPGYDGIREKVLERFKDNMSSAALN